MLSAWGEPLACRAGAELEASELCCSRDIICTPRTPPPTHPQPPPASGTVLGLLSLSLPTSSHPIEGLEMPVCEGDLHPSLALSGLATYCGRTDTHSVLGSSISETKVMGSDDSADSGMPEFAGASSS